MSRRRFERVPTKILETMLRMRVLRRVHVEARAELLTRQIEADIAATVLDASGPWPTHMPRGVH